MKKFVFFILILVVICGSSGLFAASITEEMLGTVVGIMETDFGLLLDGLNKDIDTVLLQNAVSGQNIGQAELGSKFFSNFYIGLPAITATASNGFLTFRNDLDYFEMLDLNELLNGMLLNYIYGAVEGTAFETAVDGALNYATPFPAVKLNFGFKLPANLELLVNGMYVPTALIDLLPDSVELPAGLSFNYLNVGGVVRYVLLRDNEQTPGLSIGAGAYYNNLGMAMNIGDVLLTNFGKDLPDGVNPFTEANIDIGTNTLAFGIDFAVSKKLLGFFVPYLKLGAWYALSETGGTALLMSDTDPNDSVDDSISLGSTVNHSDLDLLLSTGFDIMLGPFCSNFGADYNLGSGVWGVSLGSRFQL